MRACEDFEDLQFQHSVTIWSCVQEVTNKLQVHQHQCLRQSLLQVSASSIAYTQHTHFHLKHAPSQFAVQIHSSANQFASKSLGQPSTPQYHIQLTKKKKKKKKKKLLSTNTTKTIMNHFTFSSTKYGVRRINVLGNVVLANSTEYFFVVLASW